MNVQAFDFAAARQALVDCQVRVNDVTDKHIQAAYRRVPREAFAPAGLGEAVYSETDIEIGAGRWLWWLHRYLPWLPTSRFTRFHRGLVALRAEQA